MQEYEKVLLSKTLIQKLFRLKAIVHNRDQPTLNEIVQSMADDYNILAESDVALVFNGWEFEMIDRKEIEEEQEQ